MSRAAQRSTRALSDQELAQQNQLISQMNQQSQQDRNALLPGVERLLTSPGFSPQERSDVTQQSLGAANTAFDALRERAANRAAATNNSAGYADLLSQIGRDQAQTNAAQTGQNEIAFANLRRQDQLTGLNALGQAYGIDTGLLGRAIGVPAELLSVRQRASGSSSNGVGSLFGIGAGIASLFG